MTYAERTCECGCGRPFWPHRTDQRFVNALHRAAAWHRAHPEMPVERFVGLLGTDAGSGAPETFSPASSPVEARS